MVARVDKGKPNRRVGRKKQMTKYKRPPVPPEKPSKAKMTSTGGSETKPASKQIAKRGSRAMSAPQPKTGKVLPKARNQTAKTTPKRGTTIEGKKVRSNAKAGGTKRLPAPSKTSVTKKVVKGAKKGFKAGKGMGIVGALAMAAGISQELTKKEGPGKSTGGRSGAGKKKAMARKKTAAAKAYRNKKATTATTATTKTTASKPATTKTKFGSAFAAARKAGKKEFTWNGKRYHTRTKEEEAARTKKTAAPKPKVTPKRKPAPVVDKSRPAAKKTAAKRKPVDSTYGFNEDTLYDAT